MHIGRIYVYGKRRSTFLLLSIDPPQLWPNRSIPPPFPFSLPPLVRGWLANGVKGREEWFSPRCGRIGVREDFGDEEEYRRPIAAVGRGCCCCCCWAPTPRCAWLVVVVMGKKLPLWPSGISLTFPLPPPGAPVERSIPEAPWTCRERRNNRLKN